MFFPQRLVGLDLKKSFVSRILPQFLALFLRFPYRYPWPCDLRPSRQLPAKTTPMAPQFFNILAIHGTYRIRSTLQGISLP
jgi:hypothetical protein